MAGLRRCRSPATLVVLLLCLILGSAVPSHAQDAVCDCTSQCEAVVVAKAEELKSVNALLSEKDASLAEESRRVNDAEKKANEALVDLNKAREEVSSVKALLSEKDASLAEEGRRAEEAERKASEALVDLNKAREEVSSAKALLNEKDASLAEEGRRAEEAEKKASAAMAAAEQFVAEAEAEAAGAHDKVVAVLEGKANKCGLDLAESVSKQNEAMQSATSLRDSLERLESDRKREVEELRKKIESQTKDVEKAKTSLKSYQDRYKDTRKELIDVQAKLREAHKKLVSKYVNTTLIIEDAAWLVATVSNRTQKAASDGMVALGDGWKALKEGYHSAVEIIRPMVDEAKVLAEPHLRSLGDAYERGPAPHVRKARKSAEEAYNEHARPVVDAKIMPFVEMNLVPIWARTKEAAESVRLTVVSAMQQSSRAAIDALDVEAKEQSSPVRKAAIDTFSWTNKNAEQIVEVTATYGGPLLFLYFCGAFVMRTVLFFLLLPFFPLRFLFGRKKEVEEDDMNAGPAPKISQNGKHSNAPTKMNGKSRGGKK